MHRSPPSTAFASPLQHYASDTNIATSTRPLSESLSFTNIASRNINRESVQRKNDDITKSEIIDLFTALKKDQDEKFSAILSSVGEVKVALDFMYIKYEEVLQRLSVLEDEKKCSDTKIQLLENQIDYLERQAKGTSIELRNVPQVAKESKDDLKKIILKTAEALSITLNSHSDIKNIYRINSSTETKPIIADFTTVLTRDNFLSSYKQFNKEHLSNKLSTETLGISGRKNPIYLDENLTQRDRKLYYLARQFVKESGYTYCWISYGRVFVRKSEGTPRIRITSEGDLATLGNKQVQNI